MSKIAEGEKAPDFKLPASSGGEISLADYKGKKHVVLYFYPKDMTPGCTVEACSFRDLVEDFAEVGAVILGVSTDDLASHDKFTEAHHLNFPLLSDTEARVCQQYGVWKEKNMYGKKKMGVERTTFVVDKAGVIRKIYPKVQVEQHADEVLAVVKSLS